MSGSSRAVLITGCSSGIGQVAADTLRERGYRLKDPLILYMKNIL